MPGGGAKPGERRGGRQKGSVNKVAAAKAAAVAASGLTPLDYMLQVLRAPESTTAEKAWAAKEAAPYCHPRLTSVDHTIKTRPARELSDDELLIIAAGDSGEAPSGSKPH